MALIVEDGSIVAGANSYVDLIDARAYAAARGETLPTVDADLEALLIVAVDYLEAQRDKYKGAKVSAEQSLQWPRYNVTIDGFDFESDAIPNELISAQIELAIEVNSGTDLLPTSSGGFITKDVTGPLETEYSEKIGTSIHPTMSSVDALLKPLYSATGYGLTTLRI